LTVTASAIAGEIVDPRPLLRAAQAESEETAGERA
jgi:hypothetical protein